MEELKKEKINNILNEISKNNKLIKKLVVYLKNNNLLEDLYSKVYYIIEKSEPIYKIKYYKSKNNGTLLSLSDVENSHNLLEDNLEDYIVYVYDEIKALHFIGQVVGEKVIRCQEYSKSYDNMAVKIVSLDKNNEIENVNWVTVIKENPLLFVYIIVNYNINVEEIKNIDEKSYIYKKEIKKN